MRVVAYISGLRQGDGKELADFSHTLPCYLSKLRCSLEAAKSKATVFLWGDKDSPLPLLWSPYGDLEMARNEFEDGSKWCTTIKTYMEWVKKQASWPHEPMLIILQCLAASPIFSESGSKDKTVILTK